MIGDVWPGSSYCSPSPLWPQQSTLPYCSLKGKSQTLIFRSHSAAWNAHHQAPWATAKQMEASVLPGWFLLLVWYSSVSFHIIIFDHCHKTWNHWRLMSAQKSFPELNHARLNQQTLVSFPFCMHVSNLSGHSCQKLPTKVSGRCSEGLTVQEKCSISGSLFKGRSQWNKIFFILYSNLVFWSSEEILNIYKAPVPNLRINSFSSEDFFFFPKTSE